MKLIVCVDEHWAMAFNARRQSRDRAVTEDILALTRNGLVWMEPYSVSIFPETASQIRGDEAFLEKAGPEDYCFAERCDLTPVADKVSQLILYRWNRHYPGDVKFPADVFTGRWQCISQTEFAGVSHSCITREVYVL